MAVILTERILKFWVNLFTASLNILPGMVDMVAVY